MKVLKRALYAVVAIFIGFAAGIRLCSGLLQAYGISIGLFAPMAIAALCGSAAAVFAPQIERNLTRHTITNTAAMIICVILCVTVFAIGPMRLTSLQTDPYVVTGVVSLAHRLGMALIVFTALLYFLNAVAVVFSFTKIKAAFKSVTRKDIIFAAAVLVILNILMILFCLNNKTICFWDNAGFWITSHELADVYRNQGIIELMKQIMDSVFTTDYNYIIALPATALTLLFGNTRLVFILGIANIYLYPLMLLIYAFARGSVKKPCFAAAITLISLPLMFYITKEGYVDVGAILFAMAAMILWMRSGEDKSVERFIIIGVLLFISMILRRWLVFFVVSYIAALAVDCIFYRKSAVPVVSVLAAITVPLVSFFQPYITLKLMADYGDMYAAYDRGLYTDIIGFTHVFGIIIMAVVVISMIMLCIFKKTRQRGMFLAIQIAVCFAVFVHIQSHDQQHLLLYIPAFACTLCIAIGAVVSGRIKLPAMVVCCLYALVSVYGVTLGASDNTKRPALIADTTCLPARRYDTGEVLRLVRWLDKNVGEKNKHAAILASSLAFNREILCNAEGSLNVTPISMANKEEYLMWLPQVDSRDGVFYPIYDADYVITSDPIQLHMSEENQQSVVIPARTFLNGENIANAYKKLDESFSLGWDGSIHVYIYEKQREATIEEQSEYDEIAGKPE
ncbi:MAG: hypothetical protein J1G06_07060 [Oscillospiraceae bacterium]|nr:hypothetical protein [Oscillospiraceae bacterium]